MNTRSPIYLDYAATTPVDPRVAEVMIECLRPDGAHGNPSSVGHEYGRRARALVEKARAQVAASIGARPECIVWTSGATESDNLAILGAARFRADRGSSCDLGAHRAQGGRRCAEAARAGGFRSHMAEARRGRRRTPGTGRRGSARRYTARIAHACEQRDRRHSGCGGSGRPLSRPRRHISCRRGAERRQAAHRCRGDAGGPAVAHGAQDLRTEGRRRSVRAAQAARRLAAADVWRRSGIRSALGHARHASDRRYGHGV